MAMTPNTLKALVLREDSLVESPADPKLDPPIDPGQDQGRPLGDQGLPSERQGQAQARGGLGQAQGGQVPRSAGQAPSLLGMLGHIPSHVSLAASAASASVVPISRYFGTQKRQAIELNAHRVICPKHARGAHGSRDYVTSTSTNSQLTCWNRSPAISSLFRWGSNGGG